MNAPWWDVLGIARDSDRAAKRRAYAAKLKLTNPEDDPQGFMALRQAYETALDWVEYDGDWDEQGEGEWDVLQVAAPNPPVANSPMPQPFEAPVATIEQPDPRAQAIADEHAELRKLTAALEAGLRGPWFKDDAELDARLRQIIAAPALIEIETRDAIEYWLAELLADTVPRSDAILLHAIAAFGWEQEGERPPAVWRILARIDEWRLIESLSENRSELGAGWRTLTRKGEPPWQRRIGALRSGVAGQVERLFELADYQAPGLTHSFDAQAATWWREHLDKPRFGFVDLVALAVALVVFAPMAVLAQAAAVRWIGAAALLAGLSFPIVRLRIVAPWRRRRELDHAPLGWISHGWAACWAAALLLLITLPSSIMLGGAVASLSVIAALWMAAIVGREPRIGNPLWRIISFGALALVGTAGFVALTGPEQLAFAAFAGASAIIATGGRDAVAELLWRVGDKPVLAATIGVSLAFIPALVRTTLGTSPAPLVPWGAVAIGGMVLMSAVREIHDGSVATRLAPLLRWALWAGLVVAAILSAPEDAQRDVPPLQIGASEPIERLEPGFAAIKAGNPELYAAVERIRKASAAQQNKVGGKSDWEQAWREIDRLVNAAYRERLPTAPAALIAAEMDIRLATLREQQKRDPASCASETAAASFTPSETLRKRHYRHALAVAGSTPEPAARQALGREIPLLELYRQADQPGERMAGTDAKAKCATRIAVLEALTAQSDADIAKTMRPGLIARAAETSVGK